MPLDKGQNNANRKQQFASPFHVMVPEHCLVVKAAAG
jgi:hypothetical protein